MIDQQEYRRLRTLHDTYEAARLKLCKSPTCVTAEEQKLLPTGPTNAERSAIEVYEFVHHPPDRYFVYINEQKRIATTWTGDELGKVAFGREWCDNFGGKRVPVTITAINGRTYHGTYYKSSGDYARIKVAKRHAA